MDGGKDVEQIIQIFPMHLRKYLEGEGILEKNVEEIRIRRGFKADGFLYLPVFDLCV